MKPKKSLLNQYVLINFLVVTLLPILILVASVGVFPSGTNEEGHSQNPDFILIVGLMLGLFIILSWIFFYRIRKRLLRLRNAMTNPADSGIPLQIPIEKGDEIGQLADSFNHMVHQLEESRNREQEEEALRRQLIANLSHDLRTPLTTIRGHAYLLKKEQLSVKGQESLTLIDNKINHLGQLIEDLLSYTLLTSRKYPYRPVTTDMVRLVRTSFAAWYPIFENMGFHMDLDVPEATFKWEVDPRWMERTLDNFYQNISRHAQEGKYIGIKVDAERERIVIEDHGPGMDGKSAGKGAGIGLSIAALMLKEMKLHWEFETNEKGTKIMIDKE